MSFSVQKISWGHAFTLLAFVLVASSASFFLGVYIEKENNIKKSKNYISLVSENTENIIPVIHLYQIENGVLKIEKNNTENNTEDNTENSDFELRIMLNNNPKTLQVFTKNTKALLFDVREILPKIDTVPAPAWAKFVGSKRGSTFWPLDHPRAFILTPKNRVFFKSKEDALAKKYKFGVK